ASLCVHEFGHAYFAFRGGDRAVAMKGYLSLDPRRYTDPVLSLILPLVFLVIGGIPLPGGAVWINHHALRSRRTESTVSLAGPLSNLFFGIVLSLIVRFAFPQSYYASATGVGLAAGLSFLALLQIFAFIINILPIPGLDGWGAIEPWLSPQAQAMGAKVRPWAPLVLFVALFAVQPIQQLFFFLSNAVFGLFGGNTGLTTLGEHLFLFWRF
ncbi:MAG: site-2 protease family protein, partial [Sciscionella sp.]